ncbi:hypothetical protein GOP47_0021199 [Adiantum capillus-veneris]|uniref:non-specific serine/threonine protein kinase n=1 Tax=Adiantum capillus-veneris TaxID=13818 RepID=A0A9D4UC81_ADICA|nr:hypothetical protein GOP47_0021199 [Adiantum capillus-veneris]
MVASFPEFDYKKHRSQPTCIQGGCVPSAHCKPNRLKLIKSSLLSRAHYGKGAAADSTLLGKILSFHGNFGRGYKSSVGSALEYPNGGRHCTAQNSVLGISASKFVDKKKCDSLHVGNEPTLDRQNTSGECNVGKNGDFAGNSGRKWSSFKATKLHSRGQVSKMGIGGGDSAECKSRNEHASAAEIGSSTRSSASTHLVALSAIGDELKVNCEVSNLTMTVEKKSGLHNVYLDAGEGGLGMHKCAQNCGEGRKAIALQQINANDVASSSNGGREQANCENSKKASSSATGLHNFGSESFLYASDNSSNNMRWSSTSCASTDTSSSNSTRRSSGELRIPSVPLSVPFFSQAKPHKAHDATWAAIHNLQLRNGGIPLSIAHFKLICRVGHGDIGSVFLAHLKETVVASPSDASYLFAIKVMDKDALAHRNKLQRMHMEKEILEAMDHPFLPTLYAHFNSDHFSCLVMDFCPGGDLYALRQKQPGKRFDMVAARFYVAEVLLALEYLHMLGIVYRDLKPENVLVRQDGHIMLTDFDLSLKCDVKPQLLKHPFLSSSSLLASSSSSSPSKRRLTRSHSQSSAISSSSRMSTMLVNHDPINCRLPAACSIDPIVSCLSLANTTNKKDQHTHGQQAALACLSMAGSKLSKASCSTSNPRDGIVLKPPQSLCHAELPMSTEKLIDDIAARGARMSARHAENHRNKASDTTNSIDRASKSDLGCQEENMVYCMELVAEPTQARSMSFVGTHEYLAPEIITGHGHGSPVDWWTLGIFLYELLFGRTPFKGASNDQTLINIIKQQLRFPRESSDDDDDDFVNARSLIQALLAKDPRKRLGCIKGAAELKQHAFFKGVNWALIRCTRPPDMPCSLGKRQASMSSYHQILRHNTHRQTAYKALYDFDLF